MSQPNGDYVQNTHMKELRRSHLRVNLARDQMLQYPTPSPALKSTPMYSLPPKKGLTVPFTLCEPISRPSSLPRTTINALSCKLNKFQLLFMRHQTLLKPYVAKVKYFMRERKFILPARRKAVDNICGESLSKISFIKRFCNFFSDIC